MMLSGLALAGANQGLQGNVDSNQDDGILYSLEILGMNLQGTELVALSACKTAEGVDDYSDGMYGLVRAFRVAGANSILMTHWEVTNKDSREFMVQFYKNWLSPPESHPSTALRQTKLDFIKKNDEVLSNPYVWAPYVLVGAR